MADFYKNKHIRFPLIFLCLFLLTACTNQSAEKYSRPSITSPPTPQVLNPSTIQKNLAIQNVTTGQALAVIDSGCSPLSSHIVDFKDFVNGKTSTYDDSGHGTSVTYLATRLIPNIKIIELKVLNQDDEATPEMIIQALNWIAMNYQTYHIKVINLSLSLNYDNTDYNNLQAGINTLYNDGIVMVAASENFSRGATLPANNQHVISVGSIDDPKTQSQVYTYGSNINTLSMGGHQMTESGTSYSSIIVSSYVLSELSNNTNFNINEVKGILK